MMVSDHSAANQKLVSLAASKNVMLPKTLGDSQQAMRNRLENLEGKQFDKSYVQVQLKAHEDTVKLLENEISSGQDADAKAFAQSVLPTIRHHLEAAQTLAGEEGVKAARR
jgi:putative membrane protein